MYNLSRSSFLLCLMLFSHVTVKGASLQLQVYDYAGIGAKPLGQVALQLEDILQHAGMSVQATICRGSIAVACDEQGALNIRILTGYAKTMRNVRRPPLGQAFAGHMGGGYATVFLGAVQDQAAAANVPWVVVLANAAAHEVGHLLLGDLAHTQRGLMREIWDRNDYEAMNRNRLHFTGEQAQQLAACYAAER
jgi:hypothetical protein